MTRTVHDAAMLLNVLAAKDPLDPATERQRRPADYTADLATNAMKGARIGVPSDPADSLNDCYYGKLSPRSASRMVCQRFNFRLSARALVAPDRMHSINPEACLRG